MNTAHTSQINWTTLGAYVSSIREFTASHAPELHHSSFERISKANIGNPPKAQKFKVNGGSLGFRHYAAPASDQALVLIHGAGCFADLMQDMARSISSRNAAHVYTLDMRGHGLSEGKRGHALNSLDETLEDIAAFVEYLHSFSKYTTLTLGGHSIGGGSVLAFARSPFQHRISSYLFLAPFLGLGCTINRPHFGGWVKLRTFALIKLVLLNLFGIKRFNDATVLDFNVKPAEDPRYVASWSLNTLLGFGPGLWDPKLAALPADKPVLVLAGLDDECFFQDRYEKAFQSIAPHAEMPYLGHGGHWDLLVDELAIERIITWLAGQAQGRVMEVADALHRGHAA